MAKRMYTSVDGKARLVKKMYTGVNGIARKVKKAYVGVGGVARQFFSTGPELVYQGPVTAFPTSTYSVTSTCNGNHMMFAGGQTYNSSNSTSSVYNNTVVVYDKSFLRTQLDGLSVGRVNSGGASVNGYMLIAGGYSNESSPNSKVVDCYSANLTHSTIDSLSNITRSRGLSTPSYAVFTAKLPFTNNVFNYYNSSLVRGSASLSFTAYDCGRAIVGDYFLIAGGYGSSTTVYSTCDAFTSNLVRTSCSPLSVARTLPTGSRTPSYALFCGGHISGSRTLVVDTYNSQLVKGLASNLPSHGPNSAYPDTSSYVTKDGVSLAVILGVYDYYYSYDDNLTLSYSVMNLPTSSTAGTFTSESIGGDILFTCGSSSDNGKEVFRLSLI